MKKLEKNVIWNQFWWNLDFNEMFCTAFAERLPPCRPFTKFIYMQSSDFQILMWRFFSRNDFVFRNGSKSSSKFNIRCHTHIRFKRFLINIITSVLPRNVDVDLEYSVYIRTVNNIRLVVLSRVYYNIRMGVLSAWFLTLVLHGKSDVTCCHSQPINAWEMKCTILKQFSCTK